MGSFCMSLADQLEMMQEAYHDYSVSALSPGSIRRFLRSPCGDTIGVEGLSRVCWEVCEPRAPF